MSTWSQTVRHPWFDASASKRRLPAGGVDSDEHYPPKRRKCHSLEHGFAHLSLDHTTPGPFPSLTNVAPSLPSAVDLDVANMEATHAHEIHKTSPPYTRTPPISVDSSTHDMEMEMEMDVDFENDPHYLSRGTPPAEVKSEEEDCVSKERDTLDIKAVEISSALLARLKQQPKTPAPFIPISSPSTIASSSQALVLFRPLRPPSPNKILNTDPGDHPALVKDTPKTFLTSDGNAMDVER